MEYEPVSTRDEIWISNKHLRAEIERLRAALGEIAKMRREDMPVADGLPEDNLAAYHARLTLEQNGDGK